MRLILALTLFIFTRCSTTSSEKITKPSSLKLKNSSGELIEFSSLSNFEKYELINCPDSTRLDLTDEKKLTSDIEESLQKGLKEILKFINTERSKYGLKEIEITLENIYLKAEYIDSYVPFNNIVDRYVVKTGVKIEKINNFVLYFEVDTYNGKIYKDMRTDSKRYNDCETVNDFQSYYLYGLL